MIRQGRLIGIFCLLWLAGCAKEEKKLSGWASFPVAIYTDTALTSDSQAQGDFQAAMDFWETSAGRRLFDYRGEWAGSQPFTGSPSQPSNISANVIFFQNPWPFPANTAGMTVVLSNENGTQGSLVMLNPGVDLCGGECEGDHIRTSRQQLIAHELGHFIGLPHTDDKTNIMYYSLSPGGNLKETGIDRAALTQITR